MLGRGALGTRALGQPPNTLPLGILAAPAQYVLGRGAATFVITEPETKRAFVVTAQPAFLTTPNTRGVFVLHGFAVAASVSQLWKPEPGATGTPWTKEPGPAGGLWVKEGPPGPVWRRLM